MRWDVDVASLLVGRFATILELSSEESESESESSSFFETNCGLAFDSTAGVVVLISQGLTTLLATSG